MKREGEEEREAEIHSMGGGEKERKEEREREKGGGRGRRGKGRGEGREYVLPHSLCLQCIVFRCVQLTFLKVAKHYTTRTFPLTLVLGLGL